LINQLPECPIIQLPDSERLDRRPAAVVGRSARLEMVFTRHRGRTVLAHVYAEPPFRVGRILDFGDYVLVIVVCCGPGVFGGDLLEQSVHIHRGARVLLVSQSALQVHPNGAGDAARLESRYAVDEDGELDCFWDAVIPFTGARLAQRTGVDVSEGGRIFWSEALMSGRIGLGEAWRFEELGHELRLTVGGSLKYLERYHLVPRSRGAACDWRAGSAHYLGTVLALDPAATALSAECLHQKLTTLTDLRSGVDCLAPGLVVGRLLATRGPQFAVARAIVRDLFKRPPLRKT
jgi:urease accessory protein